MSKIYLKRVKGGDCPDCYCKKDSRPLCRSEFNKFDDDGSYTCVQKDIHYVQVPAPEEK